ncbi:hypothetical protein Tco_1012111, partial [Tanacetum coccineum]
HPMPEQYSEDSWTIEGWFRSGVSSISAGQTSTMTRGKEAFQMLVQRQQGMQRYEIDHPTSSRVTVLRCIIQKQHGDGPPMELPGVTCDTKVRSHRKNFEEASMSKDRPGSESSAPSWRSSISSLEAGEFAPPKEDMSRHHPRKDKSTIPPDQHTTPKREGKELMKQDEAIKGPTQLEKI